MEKAVYQFEDFLAEVKQDYEDFVTKIHEALVQDGYKVKIVSKVSGFLVSYSHSKTKRVILNFLFRRKGLLIRLYADNFNKYTDFLDRLPEKMEKEIEKAPVCKRLTNPEDCSPKCIMGYDFFIKDKHYQKCRYSCFQFEINPESIPVLSDFVENERKERM